MPRISRVVLPNHPHHVVQRGHNRQDIFTQQSDYEYFLATLREWKEACGVKVYAFCLMSNHVHLVLETPEEAAMLPRLMKRLAGRQTRYTNRLVDRRGTLWESRYKSSAIQTDKYLLACCRYVELNPVRAGMVDYPEEYPWSSYSERMHGDKESWLDSSDCFTALGGSAEKRRRRYEEYVASAIPEGEWQLIREAVQRGQLTGDNGFIGDVEQLVGRRIERRGRGRPRSEPRVMEEGG